MNAVSIHFLQAGKRLYESKMHHTVFVGEDDQANKVNITSTTYYQSKEKLVQSEDEKVSLFISKREWQSKVAFISYCQSVNVKKID